MAFFLLACSPHEKNRIPEEFKQLKNLTVYSADTKLGKTISFKEIVAYGNTDKVLFTSIGDVAVDNLGRVFIADNRQKTIGVFEPNGSFLTHIGREGRGPGEFDNIRKLQIVNDNLYVFDPAQFRVTVFSLSTFLDKETIMLARNRSKYTELKTTFPWIHDIYVLRDESFLAKFISSEPRVTKDWDTQDTEGSVYFLDGAGNIVGEKLVEFREDTRVDYKGLTVPVYSFYGRTLTVLDENNLFFLAEPQDFLIKVYNMDGTYSHCFYYPITKISLNQESALQYNSTDLFIRNMKYIDYLPKAWPVLVDLKIDNQNRIWVATTVEDMSIYEWWVLESSGELITKFKWPRDESIKLIRDNYIYVKQADKEQIVRYHFQLQEEEE